MLAGAAVRVFEPRAGSIALALSVGAALAWVVATGAVLALDAWPAVLAPTVLCASAIATALSAASLACAAAALVAGRSGTFHPTMALRALSVNAATLVLLAVGIAASALLP